MILPSVRPPNRITISNGLQLTSRASRSKDSWALGARIHAFVRLRAKVAAQQQRKRKAWMLAPSASMTKRSFAESPHLSGDLGRHCRAVVRTRLHIPLQPQMD